MNNIMEINELLTKTFQQKCFLIDDSKLVYKLRFPNIDNVIEFENFKKNTENFLAQYDIEVGASTLLFLETGRIYELQIKKLPLNKLLEKLARLSQNLYLHAALDDPLRLLSMLSQKDINLNCRNINGETPLQIAEQKKDVLLGKRLIDAMLNSKPEIEKPDFCLQELAIYWDTQLKNLANELPDQSPAEAKLEEVDKKTGEQKIKNIINFFSGSNSANDKQTEEPTTSLNLGK